MPTGAGPMPRDSRFPPVADDWRSQQEFGTHVVFREGKWWFEPHWLFHGKNLHREQARRDRNLAIRSYFGAQTTDPGL